jgi:2-oxoglutarate-Fe(II)-dependent oxygenase superfamily protein
MTTPQPERNAGVHKLIRYPWPHLIVDNFLTSEVLAQSLLEIGADAHTDDMEPRGTGRIEYSLLKSETLWRAIYSRSTVSLLSSAFGVGLKLNKHNMLQLRRMNEDTPEFPLHNDYTSNEDTIASFLYLSNKWSRRCGGRLHLFESNEQSTPVVSINPIQNRFIAFRTSASHWHSVEKVYGWERFSVLSLWNVEDPNTP